MVEVELLSYTKDPINTIWKIWMESKTNSYSEQTMEDKFKLFKKLISMDVPVIENVSLTFLIKNVSISWREQAVRHRIGTKVDDKIGIDMIPDYHDSSFWSSSMRIRNMSTFYDDKKFRIPDSIKNSESALDYYLDVMSHIQNTYELLVETHGIPYEDARELIPLGATHDITWTLNLKALKHITCKRSCWILQSSLWHPVITGMIEQMGQMISGDIAAIFAEPECVQNGKYVGCVYREENRRRLDGEDVLPVCPIYLYHEVSNTIDINKKGIDLAESIIVSAYAATINLKTVSNAERFEVKMMDDLERFYKYWGVYIYDK